MKKAALLSWLGTFVAAAVITVASISIVKFGKLDAPPKSWDVGEVESAQLLSNLVDRPSMEIGFASSGGAVVVPSSRVELQRQTLIKTPEWQFLIDHQWLVPQGTALVVWGKFNGPKLCIKGAKPTGDNCVSIAQQARTRAPKNGK